MATVSGVVCVCPNGFGGLNCTTPVCELEPCFNGGSCVDGIPIADGSGAVGEHTCSCPAGLFPPLCGPGAPRLTTTSLSVSQDAAVGTTVGTVLIDSDTPSATFTFSLTGVTGEQPTHWRLYLHYNLFALLSNTLCLSSSVRFLYAIDNYRLTSNCVPPSHLVHERTLTRCSLHPSSTSDVLHLHTCRQQNLLCADVESKAIATHTSITLTVGHTITRGFGDSRTGRPTLRLERAAGS